MKAEEFYEILRKLRIAVWREGDQLRYLAPQGTITEPVREQIKFHKPQLLALVPKGRPPLNQDGAPLPTRGSRFDPFPLTDIQQAYYVGRADAFELGSVGCHVYVELDLEHLDTRRLERVWRSLVARHDMLRAVALPGGQEQQVLETVPEYEIAVTDTATWDKPIVSEYLHRIRDELGNQIFDPHRWPLFDIRATKISPTLTRVHCSVDLLVIDAMTLTLLIREWCARYENESKESAPLAFSFRDYVLMEQEWRKQDAYQHSMGYWTNRLDRLSSAPSLPRRPSRRQDANTRRSSFVRHGIRLEPAKWSRLVERARARGVTPSALLLAAFADVLAVWTNSNAFAINVTLFNRRPFHSDVAQIVGEFTSTILLEVQHQPNAPFHERATQIGRQLWQDIEHSAVTGVEVLRQLAARSGARRAPLMPIVFTSLLGHGRPSESAATATCAWERRVGYAITQTPQVSLDHQVRESDGALEITWDAVAEIFAPATLETMLAAFRRHLLELAESDEAWNKGTPSFVDEETLARRRAVEPPRCRVPEVRLEELVERAVHAHPEARALIEADGRAWTYSELWERSGRVAAALVKRGVQPNELVAIALSNGWGQSVAALGVLRSGAAYLPIDPELPRERIEYLLGHGLVRVTLTDSQDCVCLPKEAEMVCIDGLAPAAFEVRTRGRPNDLAYVIYTSGSTGDPKGVAVEHQAVVNTVLDVNKRFSVGPGDRIFGLSSLSFDLSVYDIFGTLAAGATLVLSGRGGLRDVTRWAPICAREGVTVWNSVPALLEMFCEYVAGNSELRPHGLRLALLSGDWIPLGLPGVIREMVPSVQVVSLGGATEVAIWSIHYPIGELDPVWSSIPYGRPLTNQNWQVLGPTLAPCPDWVSGNLFIGGAGLARGYWRDEKTTEASFITHPTTKERLYRTGDVGRCLPSGDIELLGRDDLQVKINGVRIELGEVENALARDRRVRSAAAVAVGPRERRRLVGFVVLDRSATLSPDELRAGLRLHLSESAIPTQIQVLDAMPMSANEKLDRKALLRMAELNSRAEGSGYVAPTTDVERTQAPIWADVLKLERVGIHEDFFQIGGNSLIALQLTRRLSTTFGVEVTLGSLLRAPTVSRLGEEITELILKQLEEMTDVDAERAVAPNRDDP